MKLYKLLVFIIGVSFSSCEYDYDVDLGEFTPKVVVNSIIHPDSTVKATLSWSRHIDDTSSYKVVARFTAKLYENSSVIFDGEGIDGALTTTVHPKEGAKYRLEVNVPQYGKLSAETSIPLKPTADLNHVGVMGNPWNSYFHFTINKIIPDSETRSVMIKILNVDTAQNGYELSNLYTNNAFCDQFNTENDMEDVEFKGSSVYHEYYIRIPYKNIHQAVPLKFSINQFALRGKNTIVGYKEHPIYDPGTGEIIGYEEYPIYATIYKMLAKVIAPSNEYDKYYKSAYQQNAYINIFSNTYSVHSNIENGLGIFAGYSSASVTITF